MNEKRRTILVVDDVPEDILIIEEILKREYQVKAVTSGEAALKIARSDNPPDLILLDIMMPEMDGFEVCCSLRQSAEGAMIPVIFLTAKVMNSDEKLGFELGAVDYIRKPVEPEIVRTRIKAHLEQKDQAIRSSEVRFRRLFETSKDGIMIIDNGTGMVIDANPSMSAIMGLSQEYFLGKRATELEFLAKIINAETGFPASRQHEYVRYMDQPMITVDGRSIYVEFIYNSYKVNQREVTQINIRDITKFVTAEHERDTLSARLSHYLSTSPTVTYALRIVDGKAPLQWLSENVQSLLGYTPEEAMAGDWWLLNVHSEDRSRAIHGVSRIMDGGSFAHEYRFHKKNREIVWLRDEMRFVPSERGEAEIVGTLTDITDRKKVEADLALNSTALDEAANAILICHRNGVVRWINPAFEKMTGISRAEAMGKNVSDLVEAAGLGVMFDDLFWDRILSGQVWHQEIKGRRRNGEFYSVEVTITPVRDDSRRVSGFIGIMSDVTELRLAQERIEASLQEKEVLLREIHHRTKNNMQLITSLLSLSSQRIADPDLLYLLGGITRRIVSISLAHEQFYNSPNMARIDFALYLHDLTEGFRGDPLRPKCKVSILPTSEAILLNLEQAIPAGLIASELIANAFEHGYPHESACGEVQVSLRLMAETIELVVRDFGTGLPAGFEAEKAESLGMILMRTLTEQLRGTLAFRSLDGTEAILCFPAN
jgi:PAS domain S-box-containing protein